MFGWFKSEARKRRRKVKLDRKHLEARARRFLETYLDADERRKPLYYRAVDDASMQCQPANVRFLRSDLADALLAEATSDAAMAMVMSRLKNGASKDSIRTTEFGTDAYATVAVAYHRAAGVYTTDEEMQELGTAAVHLLTMATSYLSKAQR